MKRSAAVLIATVVVICLLLWAGWHNLRARRMAMQQAEENHVRLVPAAPSGASAAQPGGESSLRGKPAPGFTLVDLDGKKVSLSDYKGRPVVVNFWATWCAPCKEEMPWFQQFRQQYAAQGLEILGVDDMDDDAPKDKVAQAARQAGVSYPILIADKKMESLYGDMEYLPTSFYVGRDGTVVLETAGLGSKDELEANIRKITAITPTSKPAGGM